MIICDIYNRNNVVNFKNMLHLLSYFLHMHQPDMSLLGLLSLTLVEKKKKLK